MGVVNIFQYFSFDREQAEASEVLYKEGVLKIFAVFTGKHLWNLFLLKKRLASNVIEKTIHYSCFPLKFTKFLKIPILKNVCKRLLLEQDEAFTEITNR